MTNYYTTFISKAELAHLRKSHAALRGWCGRYRREIEAERRKANILTGRLQFQKEMTQEFSDRIAEQEAQRDSLLDQIEHLEKVIRTDDDRIAALEAQIDWLNKNSTFYEPNGHNKPALDSVSKRIWYHATDDTESYPFSAVIDKALERSNGD